VASILAIDDEPGILDIIQSILSKDGYFVTGVTDAANIDYSKISSFDLIVLDIMMPGIDGFTLCKKLRNQGQVFSKEQILENVFGFDSGWDTNGKNKEKSSDSLECILP